jgi:hypothetical protein
MSEETQQVQETPVVEVETAAVVSQLEPEVEAVVTKPTLVPAPASQDLPPEVAGEPEVVQDPSILGELEKNEVALLQAIQAKQRALTFQLGELEIRKAMILGQVQALDNQASGVYKNVANRLHIGDTVHWTVTGDHKIRAVPAPTAMPKA